MELAAALPIPGPGSAQAQETTSPASIAISGELAYLARIALPPDSLVLVEIADPSIPGGRVISEVRSELQGRQAPIPFSLEVDPKALSKGHVYHIRPAILLDERLLWVAEPIELDPATEAFELGTLLLHPFEPPAVKDVFLCGEQRVLAGYRDDRMRLEIGERSLDLRQAIAASGARYVGLADPSTSFWIKGDVAHLEHSGQTYPECVLAAEDLRGLRGGGNEPSWSLSIDATHVDFSADFGEIRITVALTEPQHIDGGVRYENLIEDGHMRISVFDRLCLDSMSGMPHPKTLEVTLDDRLFQGCGGNPATLLEGPEWVIEDLAGRGLIDRSQVTINFDLGERVWGRASCNNFIGGYQLTGESFTLGPAATTMMACSPDLMEQERRFLDLLSEVRQFELSDDGALHLVTHQGERILARPQPPTGP